MSKETAVNLSFASLGCMAMTVGAITGHPVLVTIGALLVALQIPRKHFR